MADLIFVGQFIASKAGKTGLTVTVDVDRYTISDGSRTALVTGGSATEGRRGLYHYRLASANLSLYQYVATFITADSSVDQQEIAGIGFAPDATIGAAGAGLTAVPWNAAWDAEVQSEVQDALEVNDLDHVVQVTAGSEEPTDGSYLDQIMHKSAAQTFDATTDSLEAIRDALSIGAVTVVSTVQAGRVVHVIGTDDTITISGLTISATWSKIWFTAKQTRTDADAAAILQLGETNPGAAADGLLYFEGAAYSEVTDGASGWSLTVSQAAGTVTLTPGAVKSATFDREYPGLTFDIKQKTGAGAQSVLGEGRMAIVWSDTRRTS